MKKPASLKESAQAGLFLGSVARDKRDIEFLQRGDHRVIRGFDCVIVFQLHLLAVGHNFLQCGFDR